MPSSVELSVAPCILKGADQTGNQEGWRDGCGSEKINSVRGIETRIERPVSSKKPGARKR